MDSDDLYKGTHSEVVDTGLVGLVNNWLHKSLERGLSKEEFGTVLELGAGKGQHLKHVRHRYSRYLQSDIRLGNIPQTLHPNVENLQLDAHDLSPLEDSSIDRLIATCLLVHLKDPEQALREWRRVVRRSGILSIYVPCEPGLLLRSSRYLTTRIKARRLGYNHLSLHYREHVTFFVRLNMLIKEIYQDCKIERTTYPFRVLPSWNLNLWATYQIRLPD